MFVLDKERLKEVDREINKLFPKVEEIINHLNSIEDNALRAALYHATIKYISETMHLPAFFVVSVLDLIKVEIQIQVAAMDRRLQSHIKYLMEDITEEPQKGVQ